MQVLVLAAQNAVDYKYLGVASSGSTLFRQIGGSIGVAVFGAIFVEPAREQPRANAAGRARTSRRRRTRPRSSSCRRRSTTSTSTAVTDALQPVFLVAAGIARRGILPHVAAARGAAEDDRAGARASGDGFHAARGDDALREIERSLSLLADARPALGGVRATRRSRRGRPRAAGAVAARAPGRTHAVDRGRADRAGAAPTRSGSPSPLRARLARRSSARRNGDASP